MTSSFLVSNTFLLGFVGNRVLHFSYTTLFRSASTTTTPRTTTSCCTATGVPPRSEEHTSELQSHSDLVCRLLLEKKNSESTLPTDSHIRYGQPVVWSSLVL